jgi:hypothetical protein
VSAKLLHNNTTSDIGFPRTSSNRLSAAHDLLLHHSHLHIQQCSNNSNNIYTSISSPPLPSSSRIPNLKMSTSSDVPPSPAYFPTHADSPLHPPKELYERLRNLKEGNGDLVKTQDFMVPPRSGKAWTVPKGAIWRLSTPDGPQVRRYQTLICLVRET